MNDCKRRVCLYCGSVLLALFTTGCAAHNPVIVSAAPAAPQPAGPEVHTGEFAKSPLDGVVFTLPKTVLSVDLSVERTRDIEGGYCQFNNLFMPGIKPTVDCTKTISDQVPPKVDPIDKLSLASMAITSRGVPDATKRFVLPMSSHVMVDSTDSIDLTESGSVSGVESTRTDRTGEVILSGLNAVAGIAGKVLAGVAAPLKLEDKPDPSFPAAFVADLAGEEKQKLLGSLSLLTDDELTEYKKIWNAKSVGRRQLMKARHAWFQILAIQIHQDRLLEGNSGLGTGATDILKTNMDLIEKLAGQAFLGVEKTVVWNPVFDLTPAAVKPGEWNRGTYSMSIPLFRAGKGCYANAADQLVKNTIPAQLVCRATELELTDVALRLEPADINQLAYLIDSYYDKPAQASYPFTIPAVVRASVTGLKNVAAPPQTVALAQWGTLNHMPVGKSSKGKTLKVSYYEATGALKSIKFGSDAPLNKGVIDSLSGAANSVLDGKLKADSADAKVKSAAADELAKLTRQRQILEEKDKIAKLCIMLSVSCGN